MKGKGKKEKAQGAAAVTTAVAIALTPSLSSNAQEPRNAMPFYGNAYFDEWNISETDTLPLNYYKIKNALLDQYPKGILIGSGDMFMVQGKTYHNGTFFWGDVSDTSRAAAPGDTIRFSAIGNDGRMRKGYTTPDLDSEIMIFDPDGKGFIEQDLYFHGDSIITGIRNTEAVDPITARLYPNPSSGKISVDYDVKGSRKDVNISILDLNGRELISRKESQCPGRYKKDLYMGHLNSGMYLLKIDTGDQFATMKVSLVK
jgi:hypothetical protein